MPSSASPIAMLELMATGEKGSTWGTIANTNFKILERFSNGYLSVTVDSATKTLTTATDFSLQDWHYAVFDLASATQAANFVVPSQPKLFGVVNSATGAFTMTVKTSTGGSVALDQDATAVLFNDGTDVRKLFLSTDYQPLDSDLTALAGVSSGGLLVRTGSGTAAARSIAAGTAISVANGTATGGNPTISADINGTTTATDTVATGDFLLLYDVSLGALRKATTSSVVGAAGGDVDGPGSATDNAWARFDGTTGKIIQNGTWVEDDSGNVTAGGTLDMDGNDASVDMLTARAAGQSKRTADESVDASADTDLTVDGAQVQYIKLTGDHTVNVFGGEADSNGAYAANGWVLEVEQDSTGSRDLTIQKGNELTYSADLQDTTEAGESRPWTDTNTSLSLNAAVGPDGLTTLTKLIADAVSGSHQRIRTISGLSPNQTLSISAEVKDPGDNLRLRLEVRDAGATGNVFFADIDPSTGAISVAATAQGNATVEGATVTALPNSNYRLDVTGQANTSGTDAQIRVVLVSGTSASFTGDASGGVYIGNVQVTPGQPKGMIKVGASRALDGWIGTEVDFSAQAAGTKTRVVVAPPTIDGTLAVSDITV